MMTVGLREAGIIPYRNKIKISWTPNGATSPWWTTVGDSISPNVPINDYGYPGNVSGATLSQTGSGYTLQGTVNNGAAWKGTTNVLWENGFTLENSSASIQVAEGPYGSQARYAFGITSDLNIASGSGTASIGFVFGYGNSVMGTDPQGVIIAVAQNGLGNAVRYNTGYAFDPTAGTILDLKIVCTPSGSVEWYVDGTVVYSTADTSYLPDPSVPVQCCINMTPDTGYGAQYTFTTNGLTLR